MQAYVYKSQRKNDTFVYLAARDDFERIPESLRAPLGELAFVLEVALTPERRLARENTETVRQNLAAQGFHIQFPPRIFDLQDGTGAGRSDG
ncbi:MAG: YcgL domain-containing protein [Pseudoxanthomonas sp.]